MTMFRSPWSTRQSTFHRRGCRLPSAAVRRESFTTPGDAVVIDSGQPHAGVEGPRGSCIEALERLRDGTTAGYGGLPAARSALKRRRTSTTLVASARRLGIGDRVRWLGERPDVRRLLAAADIHCQANVAPEPFGVAYVEALAAGLPVVASAAGGAIEIVDDSCGVLVPPGDAEALARALERLIVDRGIRARLAAGAPARARHLSDPATQMFRLADALTVMKAMEPAGVGA